VASRAAARLRSAPRALWACALVATVNAMVWAVVTPSWQVPDEPVHVAYAQWIAETGDLPRPLNTLPGVFDLSPELKQAVELSDFGHQTTPIWRADLGEALRSTLGGDLEREREEGAGAAANYPPLYYAAEAIPYKLASGGTILDRLLLMRFLSALLAGLTAAFTFLFVRELLPATPWAWTVGALAVALQPVAAFVSGGVNADVLLWTASAAVFWLLARVFRRGLTMRRAVGIGLALLAAMLTKGAAFALVPGVAVGLLVAAARVPRAERRRAAGILAVGGAVAAVPFAVWLWANDNIWDRGGGTTAAGFTSGDTGTIRDQLSYLWQFFLPKLPFMNEQFPAYPEYPLWDSYFQGFVGRFGYFNYGFPMWVNWLGLAVAVVVLVLAARALVRSRGSIRRRLPELAVYALLLLTTVLLVGVAGYRFRINVGLNFEQTRYLFVALPLYGALMALAARGGRRFGPALGTGLVLLCVGWNLFAVLLTIERYYA
jgi:4-amino-4-deoxy-L-arabinose transferase-like glycosyltransferase